jgi:hypothetical protein
MSDFRVEVRSILDGSRRSRTRRDSTTLMAGMPSPEMMGEEGYQVVTRARGRRTNHAAVNTGRETSMVFQFGQPVEASKKRRAEEQPETASREVKLMEQIHGLKAVIQRLLEKEEERKQGIQEMRKEVKEVKELRAELLELKKSVQTGNRGKPTYAAAAAIGNTDQAYSSKPGMRSGSQDQPQRMRVEDDKWGITINTSRFSGEKTDIAQVKMVLQRSLDGCAELEGLQIRCIRQLPGERINVVFRTEAEAMKANENTGWLVTGMPQASVKSETWYPVKCDMVAKSAVLDTTVSNGRSLRKEVCAEFAADNREGNLGFTAMKANWLSRLDPWKKTGSLVIWLKRRMAAEHLLKRGEVLFGGGACDAFCSRFETSTADKLCFNCNTYGHLQSACRKSTKCGKCTGAHQTRDCQSEGPLKCAVCAGPHRVSDWQCRRHPNHKRYLAT